MSKDSYIQFRVSSDLKDRVRLMLEGSSDSISSYLVGLIERDLGGVTFTSRSGKTVITVDEKKSTASQYSSKGFDLAEAVRRNNEKLRKK